MKTIEPIDTDNDLATTNDGIPEQPAKLAQEETAPETHNTASLNSIDAVIQSAKPTANTSSSTPEYVGPIVTEEPKADHFPIGVIVIAILFLLIGGITILSAMQIKPTDGFTELSTVQSVTKYISIVTGGAQILVAIGLFMRSDFWRTIATILIGLNLLLGLWKGNYTLNTSSHIASGRMRLWTYCLTKIYTQTTYNTFSHFMACVLST